ncbi:pyridine nucleotide-disulfide oxidoreductase domain-containing protein 1 isoform X2 [Melanaphis sacchari]|uniref:pyridine nucleotide-disulfide oxidoreductase domain-containing protein 1 isoform X2 n=1 Tax=Melanaphis sacchari TaxID=742174 RepID=UPI000DC13A04|nr:pyridine nucleotide-disulfide oxidoreductase domain-containing protein 1 isoform X2 [Melanaphis sacchari]
MSQNQQINSTYVVIGGESPIVKVVTDIKFYTKIAAGFKVEDRNLQCVDNTEYIIDKVVAINSIEHIIYTVNHQEIKYKKLCLCTGATPKLLDDKEYVIGLRDTHSVEYFQSIIGTANRVLIVGNGGIATDLVYKLNGIEIIWVIRDEHISSHFLDAGAAEFFNNNLNTQQSSDRVIKRFRYCGERTSGAALGPDWHCGAMFGNHDGKNVIIEYKTEIKNISKSDVVRIELTNGKVYECDFVISATGVIPNSNFDIRDGKSIDIASDGGIKVDWKMETNLSDIFAAGDVCTVDWKSEHWFQMRLWSQARQMGMYAAKCMHSMHIKETLLQDFCFELFTHVTSFFGFKVILLGLYNAQGLDKKDCELLVRVTNGQEYIKLVLQNGRVVGAMLIGDTDLEEMCENLILNQIDVTNLMNDLLDPNIDIEDYFD